MPEYQTDFSSQSDTPFDKDSRTRKAITTLKVLESATEKPLNQSRVLNVGSSTAVIDKYLASHVQDIICIDIDQTAIKYAFDSTVPDNLSLLVGNAEKLPVPDGSVDIVLCSHVYEHVPNPEDMLSEIQRVLKHNGFCYFAAGNRLMWNEPHHNLKGLSLLPKPLAHLYMKACKRGDYYYETHKTYWGLKSLCSDFEILDYTGDLIKNPSAYHTEYMIQPNSIKQNIATLVSTYLYWLLPSYVWVIRKKQTLTKPNEINQDREID